MTWPMLRRTRDHFFKKRFPKLDFLKAVSFKTIVDSEKMRMKKSHPPYDLCSFFPYLDSLTIFLKNFSPYPIVWKLHFLSKKQRVERGWLGNYVYSSTNLHNII